MVGQEDAMSERSLHRSLHQKRFPGESDEYRIARDELLRAELALRQRVEEVAALRRALPLGGRVEDDYVFDEIGPDGKVKDIRLSELFPVGIDTLLLYSFMFGPDWDKPCPMCTSAVDAWSGNAAYVREHAGFAICAKAPVERLRDWAEERGWRNLKLLSSGRNTFNVDYHAEFEAEHGDQQPVLHVFARRGAHVYHSWSSEMLYVPAEGNTRHVDMAWPLWNLLDLTPEGRGESWYPGYQR
jgi:predicted dithiol-disulfide oxidoreductase (DUF899 family)